MAHQGSGVALRTSKRAHVGPGYARTGVTYAPAGPPVAGYAAWWDATQIAGVNDGTVLTSWSDLSANHHDLTAHFGTPTFYKTTTAKLLNGHPAVYFNADGCLTTAGAWSPGTPATIFVATHLTPSGSMHRFVGAGGGDYAWGGDIHMDFYAGLTLNGGSWSDAFHVHTGIFNGASSGARIDGTSVLSGNAGSGSGSGVFVMGNTTAGTSIAPYLGPIGEMLIYTSALSAGNMGLVESYLTTKWS